MNRKLVQEKHAGRNDEKNVQLAAGMFQVY